MKFFISFAVEDRDLAVRLRDCLSDIFRGYAEFFISVELPAGIRWEEELRRHVQESQGLLLLLTPRSVDKRWINHESGAFWALRRKIFPILAGGTTVANLQPPITTYQAMSLDRKEEVWRLLEELSRITEMPRLSRSHLAALLSALRPVLCPRIAFRTLGHALKRSSLEGGVKLGEFSDADIEHETRDLISRVKQGNVLELSGTVTDSGIITVRKACPRQAETLVVEVKNSSFAKSQHWGQLLKLVINRAPVLPILHQRHWNDHHYIPLDDGYFVYESIPGPSAGDVDLTLVFWKVQLNSLKLRFFFVSQDFASAPKRKKVAKERIEILGSAIHS